MTGDKTRRFDFLFTGPRLLLTTKSLTMLSTQTRNINRLERQTINVGKSLQIIYDKSPEEAILQLDKIVATLKERREEFIRIGIEEGSELFSIS